ncbi:PD-(D/E)XK nuclease family transposase [Prevotella sp.]|uniref:PD-(D/E)XK nuclease family transposase n=1 Tax=Prevotella sp. TaxID=59823 RepID=UPI0025CE6ED4|nr:PD-(D/E)XK nuclease family transposase [Prevotella sp.]
MRKIEERYISLLIDSGFKRIFGTDPNKELLINFLNSLFDGEEVIKDVKKEENNAILRLQRRC